MQQQRRTAVYWGLALLPLVVVVGSIAYHVSSLHTLRTENAGLKARIAYQDSTIADLRTQIADQQAKLAKQEADIKQLQIDKVRLAHAFDRAVAQGVLPPPPQPQWPVVYITPSGRSYHRSDCSHLTTPFAVSLEKVLGVKTPCRDCGPPTGPITPTPGTAPATQ